MILCNFFVRSKNVFECMKLSIGRPIIMRLKEIVGNVMIINRLLRLGIFVVSLACVGVHSDALTVDDFAKLPEVQNVRLSPNGVYLSYIARADTANLQGYVVNVMNTETKKLDVVLYAPDDQFTINWVKWANDDQLLVSAAYPDMRWRIQTLEHRLLIVNRKTKKIRNMLSNNTISNFSNFPQFQDEILDLLPEDNDHFLLQMDGEKTVSPTVYKVSLNRSKLKTYHRHVNGVRQWVLDRKKNVRIGIKREDDKNLRQIIHLEPGKKKWAVLWEFERYSDSEVWPLGFSDDLYELYVRSRHEGRDAIFKVDLRDENLEKKLVYSNKNYDVSGDLVYSKKTGKLIGIDLSDGGYTFWDESYKKLVNALNKGLKDTTNSLISLSQDENRYVVYSESHTESGVYYLGDRKNKTLVPVAYRYRDLMPEFLSNRKFVNYKARDGQSINAFLTIPSKLQDSKNLPAIIFPNGTPLSSGGSGFDIWAQFLAYSGYVVLQMDYRGSYGNGFDFMNQGHSNYGKVMQEDIEDGTRWLIERGQVDPERICIVGSGYGGYSAFLGLVKTPDLYRCAASYAGIFDLSSHVKSFRGFTNFESMKASVGSDYRSLDRQSPLYNASKISNPVLLMHGVDDRLVKYEQSEKMARRLEKLEKPVDFIKLKAGAHNLDNSQHRHMVFKRLEKFLNDNLGEKR